MTRKEAVRINQQESVLLDLGFTVAEAEALRRISMTLRRWFERECGDGNAYSSWAIERDDNGDGPPYLVHHHYRHGKGADTVTRTRIADREAGARKRLRRIIGARNDRPESFNNWVSAFIQTDPRGAALYIIRPGDAPEGTNADAYYTRGVCVY